MRVYPLIQDESSRDSSTQATADNSIFDENYNSIHRCNRTEDFFTIESDNLNSSTNGMQLLAQAVSMAENGQVVHESGSDPSLNFDVIVVDSD